MKLFKTPIVFRWIFPRRRWGFSVDEKTVFLTFDDGPTEELTEWILSILDQQKVKATFFCVGANAEKYPDLVTKITQAGHTLGNHTMKHEKGTEISKNDYLKSIDKASDFVPSRLFRPPYGRMPMTYTRSIAKKYTIIMWTWLSYDYDHSVSVNTILEEAKRIKKGDILVLHDNQKMQGRIQELLPKLISQLKEEGFQFKAISA